MFSIRAIQKCLLPDPKPAPKVRTLKLAVVLRVLDTNVVPYVGSIGYAVNDYDSFVNATITIKDDNVVNIESDQTLRFAVPA